MKKLLVLLPLLFIMVGAIGQDVVVIKHTNYTTHFSKSKKYPVEVEWWITKAKVGCPTPLARKDNFKPDPQLPNETNLAADYVGSGTDRGHNMPAAENQCQTPAVQDECFYFSNMTAQYHSLNAGDWKSVEVLERQIAKDKGFTLSEFDLKDSEGKIVKVKSEEEIFEKLGVNFIPMEDRRAL